MNIIFDRQTAYFTVHYCYNDNLKIVGAIETHNVGVKNTYYVAWIFKKNYTIRGEGRTEMFYTWDECVKYIEENNEFK